MPTQIPPPPSGSIVDSDPSLNTAQPQPSAQPSGQIPPPPSGSIVDRDPATAEPSTLGSLASDVVAAHNDLTTGIGQGVLDTVHGTGELIRKGLNAVPYTDHLGNKVIPPVGQTALDQMSTPQNAMQKVGFTAENIAEFMLGDEALKGLSLADKMPKVARAMEVLQKQPILKNQIIQKMIATGARQGATGALQGFVHSGGDVVRAGEEGAATGALGVATEGVSATVGAAKNALKNVLDTKVVQAPLRAGIQDIIGNAAQDSGATGSTSNSIRKVAEDASEAVKAQAQTDYQALDKAVGDTRFQSFRDKLEAGRRQLRDLTGTEEDLAKEAKLLKAQKELEDAQQAAFAEAKAKGVDPNLIDRADANWRKSQALDDLDSVIKKVTSGAYPDVSSPELLARDPETVDPVKLRPRIDAMYNSGRLQDALGNNGARDFLNHVHENFADHADILRNQRWTKRAVIALPVAGTAVGFGKHYVGHMLE